MKNELLIEGEILGKKRPELKQFKSGDSFLRFYIKCVSDEGQRTETGFFTVVLYKNLAEEFNASEAWKPGRRVMVQGKLSSWKSEDGKFHVEIKGKKLQFPQGLPKAANPASEYDVV